MFGYLKFDTRRYGRSVRNTYRYYYCGLCNALKKNYGLLSTLFLSNDVTYLAMIVANHDRPENIVCPRCSLSIPAGKIPNCYSDEEWRGLATFSLGLVYAKAIDDDLDEKTFSARLKTKLIRRIVNKAYRENKSLFEEFSKAIHEIKMLESEQVDISAQGRLFSESICKILKICLPENIDDETLSLIFPTMKWLCFIDAVDDYNDDLKRHQYNPLMFSVLCHNSSSDGWRETFALNWRELVSQYSQIWQEITEASGNIKNCRAKEKELIDLMQFQQMPSKLLKVMKENSIC